MNCINCSCDISEFMDWDILLEDYISCPECGHKMRVYYDESWNGEEDETFSTDEESIWWVESYNEEE